MEPGSVFLSSTKKRLKLWDPLTRSNKKSCGSFDDCGRNIFISWSILMGKQGCWRRFFIFRAAVRWHEKWKNIPSILCCLGRRKMIAVAVSKFANAEIFTGIDRSTLSVGVSMKNSRPGLLEKIVVAPQGLAITPFSRLAYPPCRSSTWSTHGIAISLNFIFQIVLKKGKYGRCLVLLTHRRGTD